MARMVDNLQVKAEYLREEVTQVERAAARQVVRLVEVVEVLQALVTIMRMISLRLRRNRRRRKTVKRRIRKKMKKSRVLMCLFLRSITKVY